MICSKVTNMSSALCIAICPTHIAFCDHAAAKRRTADERDSTEFKNQNRRCQWLEPGARTQLFPSNQTAQSSCRLNPGVRTASDGRRPSTAETPTTNTHRGPVGWNRSPRETLIISESSVLKDGVALLTDPVACRTRKRFQASRLLSAPEGEALPALRNVSKTPDQPREEIPRLGSGCAARPGRKKDGRCPLLNNFRRYLEATY